VRFALAAFLVAAQACETGNTFIPPDGGATVKGPGVSGRWAMFGWEDPVAVDIRQAGGNISGHGCCAGLGLNPEPPCCGDVSGTIGDQAAAFGFKFDYGGSTYDYSTQVFVSADTQRMAGMFSRSGSRVAWLRIQAPESYLPDPDPALQVVMRARGGSYALVLADDPAPGGDFTPGLTYAFGIGDRSIGGDLGPFWGEEMSWDADRQILTVGPVPATDPNLPVALLLGFNGTVLSSVEAISAGDVHYHFLVMPAL